MDLFNLKVYLYASSYSFLSSSPYSVFPYPIPPLQLFESLPYFLTFINLKFSIISTVFVLKLEILLFSMGSSLLIEKIAYQLTGNERKSNYLSLVFLFSPFLFFINFILMEMDIFAIFFTLLSIYLYNKTCADNNLVYFIPIFGILVFASLMYYFPLIIILVLLIYSSKIKEFIFKVFSVLFWGFVFLFPYHFYHIWSFSNPSSIIGGSSPSIFSIYYVLNSSFNNIGSNLFYYIFIIMTIVIVIFYFKKKGINKYISMTLGLIIILLTIEIYTADEYIWVLPFAILSMLAVDIKNHFNLKILLVQIYMLPAIFVLNIWQGRFGMGTGIFYFSYSFLHRAIIINEIMPKPILITRISDLLFYAMLISISIFIIKSSLHKYVFDNSINNLNTVHKSTSSIGLVNSSKKFLSFLHHSRLIISIVLIVITLLLIVEPLSPNINVSKPDFPFGIFIPIPVADNGSINYAFTSNGHNVSISPTVEDYNQPLTFQRNISNECFNANISITSLTNSRQLDDTQILNLSNLSVSAYTYINLNNAQEYKIYKAINVSAIGYRSSFMWGYSNISIYKSYGNSTYEYIFNTSQQKYFVFFFKPIDLEFKENVVFRIQNGNSTYDLIQYSPTDFSFDYSLSFAKWAQPINIDIGNVFNWNSVDLEFSDKNISLSLNGNSWLQFPFLAQKSTVMYVGIYQNSKFANFNNSYNGYFSKVYNFTRSPVLKIGYIIAKSNLSFAILNSSVKNLEIETFQNRSAALKLNNQIIWSPLSDSTLKLGRLNYSTLNINIEFNSISFKDVIVSKDLSVNLILTYIMPTEILLAFSFFYEKNHKKRKLRRE